MSPSSAAASRTLLFSLLLAVVVAAALRCPRLAERPMHNDEAVNAVKFGQLWRGGGYRYDPNEHHGPSLFYATLAVARLTSTPDLERLSETKLRLITVCFGMGLLLLVPLVLDGLGQRATIWAAFFTAGSPAMVFYSRYYIHEMPLVFFAFLALAAGWRYWRSGKLGWALLMGAGLGLMHATKETFVITLVAAALALVLCRAWNRWLDAATPPEKPRVRAKHLAAALVVWLVVWLLLFSSFFTNPSGPIDSFRTYLPWLHRAGGASPHIHPWTFYLHRLCYFHEAKGPAWSEALVLFLAAAGALAGFARRGLGEANGSLVRFLAFYTLLLTAAYSFIAYKTPWCLLNFWQGMVLLAGVGASALIQSARLPVRRLVVALVLLAGVANLAAQAWRANGPYAADPRNPYVYAQTSLDLLNLVNKVESLADAHPQGRQMLVKVMAPDGDYWPLPWYLRGFGRKGWWEEIPPDPFAPVMIVAAKFHANLDEKKTHLMVGYFQLRPGIFLELYVEADLWRAYLAKHPPKPD